MRAPPPPQGKPDVSILVVAYNSAEFIEACLDAIPAACTTATYEVLLVDNGDLSTEALVAARYPQVTVVPSRGNVGFAAGNNLLAERAGGRFLLLLNPDLEMLPQAIDALLAAAQGHADSAAWGGVTLDRDGTPNLGNTVHVPSLREMASRVVGRSLAGKEPMRGIDTDAQVGVLSGGFVMFDRAAWDAAGGLDERYFLYCEEVDLFHRLAQMGHRFWRVAGSRGYHDIGHGEAHSPMRTLYRTAGIMQFTRLHWSAWRSFLAAVLMWTGATQRFVAGKLLGRWKPGLAKVAESHRHVALHPRDWWYGYDPQRGLMARLARRKAS